MHYYYYRMNKKRKNQRKKAKRERKFARQRSKNSQPDASKLMVFLNITRFCLPLINSKNPIFTQVTTMWTSLMAKGAKFNYGSSTSLHR